jgi:type I restriction enzyme, S subunit
LRYSFSSKQFVQGIVRNIHGGVNQNVHAENIKNQNIPLPPLTEQQTISAFLDRETGHIDVREAVKATCEKVAQVRTVKDDLMVRHMKNQ